MKILSVKLDKEMITSKAKTLGNAAWKIAKSEEALGALKIAAAAVALVHAVEELRNAKKQIGFKQ